MAKVQHILDAGHGAHDPGAVDGKGPGDALYTREKDIALAITMLAAAGLRRCGIEPILTRDADSDFLTPSERLRFANARNLPITSVHCDTATNESARGSTAIYRTQLGHRLANCIYDHLQHVQPWPDRGVREDVRGLAIPKAQRGGVIIETGFLTCTEEEAALVSPTHQVRYAEAIVHGICDYHGVRYLAPAAPRPLPAAKDYNIALVHYHDDKGLALRKFLDDEHLAASSIQWGKLPRGREVPELTRLIHQITG